MALSDSQFQALLEAKKARNSGTVPGSQPTVPKSVQPYSPGGVSGQVGVGALKGVGSTLTNSSSLGEKLIRGVGRIFTPKKYEAKLGFADDRSTVGQEVLDTGVLTPTNTAQKVGFGAEQIAEFLIPSTKIAKAEKIAESAITGSKLIQAAPKFVQKAIPLATRVAGEGATFAGIGAAQSGTTEGMAKNFATGAAIPLIGTGLAKAGEKILPKMAGKIINRLIKPNAKEFSFGKNPGMEVAQQGITGGTLEKLQEGIKAAKQKAGAEIEAKLTQKALAGKTVDIAPVLKTVDDALNSAIRSGESAYVNRLEDVKNSLTKIFGRGEGGKLIPVGSKKTILSLPDAHLLKREIGDATRWTGQAFDSDINQLRSKVYGQLNSMIESMAPGIKKIQGKYGNLLSAEKSAERAIAADAKAKMFSKTNMLGGGTLGFLSGDNSQDRLMGTLLGGLAGAGLGKVTGSPLTKSGLAKMLAKLGKIAASAGRGEGAIAKRFIGERPDVTSNLVSIPSLQKKLR